jgi:hypothetical protein
MSLCTPTKFERSSSKSGLTGALFRVRPPHDRGRDLPPQFQAAPRTHWACPVLTHSVAVRGSGYLFGRDRDGGFVLCGAEVAEGEVASAGVVSAFDDPRCPIG